MKTPTPCVCCGRVVAYKFKRQQVAGGGKSRVRHKCPHGNWCWAGDPRAAAGGFNESPNCSQCRAAGKV